jgi:Protein of unknown function (DUF2490)
MLLANFDNFMKIKISILLFLIFLGIKTNAQKTVTTDEQTWFAVFNQARFSDKWGLWSDMHIRFKNDFVKDKSLLIVPRLGLTYYVNDDVKLTAGYAYINSYPDGARTISQPEHRPWQQIQWHTKYPKVRLAQILRLEERYRRKVKNGNELLDDYDFNNRLRYNVLFTTPLTKKGFGVGGWQFVLNDEIHVNFGKNIVFNTFDQNRFFMGLAYATGKTSNIQFGYMNVFTQLVAGNQYRNIHALRVFYFQNFDFRKPKEVAK